jgi:hypothetical protein
MLGRANSPRLRCPARFVAPALFSGCDFCRRGEGSANGGALDSRQRKRGTSSATWTKIKFDRQIVAIAKVCRATVIYSDDEDVGKIAARARIKVIGLADLPLPPEDAQLGFVLTGSAEGSVQRTGDDIGQEQGPPS